MRWAKYTKLVIGYILAVVLPAVPVDAQVATGPLLITEVSPGSRLNAKEEFIELYNNSVTVIDFSPGTWAVQIASATATDWQNPLRTIILTGYLYPGYTYLLGVHYTQTSNDTIQVKTYPLVADQYFSSALTAAAGHVRVINNRPATTVESTNQLAVSDEINWGDSSMHGLDDCQPYQLASGIAAGSSLERQSMSDGAYVNTGVPMVDFVIQDNPSPTTTTAEQPDLPPSIESVPIDPVEATSADSIVEVQLTPFITELLPNPASPLTDSADEYIELYNPNTEPYNIQGYRLQSGITVKHDYVFQDEVTIPGEGYLVVYSQVTKLSLSNTSGQVRLLDPTGQLISETPIYTNAKDGIVWQLYDGIWQWSSQPTPDAANQYILPLVTLKTTTPKPVTTPKVATKKAAAVKKSTTAKVATKKAITKAVAIVAAATQPTVIHSAVLAAVVGIALLYGAYEYRHDLANRFHQLRSYRSFWRRTRPAAAGRRGH